LKPSTITLDGPAASGKSTVGALLADALDYLYFDTGVMYRAVTWIALRRGVPVEEEAAVTRLAENLHIDVLPPSVEDGRQYTILADGEDVTWKLRRPEVDANVSLVSSYAGVRTALVCQQRRVARGGCVVMVGRDIGSVVLPDADLKVYLDAHVEERAQRRWREMRQRQQPIPYQEVLDMVRRRDEIDSNRAVSPLCIPADAFVVDTTRLSIPEVMEQVLQLVQEQDPP
jgi:cytidylate kinase